MGPFATITARAKAREADRPHLWSDCGLYARDLSGSWAYLVAHDGKGNEVERRGPFLIGDGLSIRGEIQTIANQPKVVCVVLDIALPTAH